MWGKGENVYYILPSKWKWFHELLRFLFVRLNMGMFNLLLYFADSMFLAIKVWRTREHRLWLVYLFIVKVGFVFFFFGHIKGIAIIVFIEIKWFYRYTKYSLYSSLTEPFFVDYVIIVSVTAASILVCNL